MATVTDGRGVRLLRRAWIWLGMVPVSIVLVFVLGEVLPALLGYGWTHEELLPPGPMLIVGAATLILLGGPGVVAGSYGLRARAAGQAVGLLPAIIGFAVAGYFLLTTALSLIFGILAA